MEDDDFRDEARRPMLFDPEGKDSLPNSIRRNRRKTMARSARRYWRSTSTEHFVKAKRVAKYIKPENLLLIFTVIAVILGTVVGLTLNPMVYGRLLSTREKYYLGFLGDWFLRMLKMLIIPMVISSNISSIASLNNLAARWLAALSIAYYFSTAIIAVIMGIIIALTVQPGNRSGRSTAIKTHSKGATKLFDSLLYAFRNLVPESIMKVTSSFEHDILNVTGNFVGGQPAHGGYNILGPIVVSIMFGIAIRNLKEETVILAEFFHCVRRTTVYLVSIIMWASPLGIFSLIAQNIALEQNLGESLRMLSLYAATVLGGLALYGMVVLPALLYIFTKRNPLQFTKNMLQALICAAGTASSTATLPCTVRCLESETTIDHRVTKFMIPLGTTINMDGTIMYEAIAVIYIAQVMDVDLFVDDLFLIAVTSVLAGMGAASMPSAGILTMTMVLMAIGIHPMQTSLILPVDWFLDRFRTMVNVYGDAVGCAIVSKLCEAKLKDNSITDLSLVPDPADSLVSYPGGLSGVDIPRAPPQGRRKSFVPRQSAAIFRRSDGGICRIRSRIFSKDEKANSKVDFEPASACVYVVDDNTIVFKI